jgi:integrase
MPVNKRKYRSGKVVWSYVIDAPGSTRENRQQITGSGFSTKREAEDAEARRRIEEQQKHELAAAGVSIAAPLPKTLSMLLEEFFRQHVDEKLAPKTAERYHDQAAYLDPELLRMPIAEITPLHLEREWNRLLKSGGHHRKTKQPRPLSRKTVHNIAGVLSSAFARAIKWSLVVVNPVPSSEPPTCRKRIGMALTAAQQAEVVNAATGPWCMSIFLELAAATGARRGEVLALRWSDVQGAIVTISRSLTQTKRVLEFKCTKTDRPRLIELPQSILAPLESHRRHQAEYRQQFGPDYRTDLDLICANPDGSPLRPDSVSATVSALFRRLKLPKGASLHTLRHTHGSHAIASGMSLPAVSERLGHSSVRVTADIYSHAIRGQDQELARRWDEYQKRHGGLHSDDGELKKLM